jgi:hypothetical protein
MHSGCREVLELITDAGESADVTAGVMHVKPVKLDAKQEK